MPQWSGRLIWELDEHGRACIFYIRLVTCQHIRWAVHSRHACRLAIIMTVPHLAPKLTAQWVCTHISLIVFCHQSSNIVNVMGSLCSRDSNSASEALIPACGRSPYSLEHCLMAPWLRSQNKFLIVEWMLNCASKSYMYRSSLCEHWGLQGWHDVLHI